MRIYTNDQFLGTIPSLTVGVDAGPTSMDKDLSLIALSIVRRREYSDTGRCIPPPAELDPSDPDSHTFGACSLSSAAVTAWSSGSAGSTAGVTARSTVRKGGDETVPADGERSRVVPRDGDRSRDPDVVDGEALRRPATGRWSSGGVGVEDEDWWLLNVVCGDGQATFKYDISWFSSLLMDDSRFLIRRSFSS